MLYKVLHIFCTIEEKTNFSKNMQKYIHDHTKNVRQYATICNNNQQYIHGQKSEYAKYVKTYPRISPPVWYERKYTIRYAIVCKNLLGYAYA